MRFATFLVFWLVMLVVSCHPKLTPHLQDHNLLRIDSTVGTDSALYAYIKPYSDSIQGFMNEVIGYNANNIHSSKPNSPLSNFVADLVLEAGKAFLDSQSISNAEVICLINIKGLRAPLSKGVVTTRQIFEIMPFENKMVAINMNAGHLSELFDHIAKSGGDGLAGATFTIENDKARDILINGKPLKADHACWVITSDYLADGGDSYTVFKKSARHLVSNGKVRELMIEHIKKLARQNQMLVPDTTTRIFVKNKN
jgi:2',3'-cyclic-nucleotide 2'-phosphodiesterase (5'-nucleotidase family)